jgi:predicted Zn-dependent peptidase
MTIQQVRDFYKEWDKVCYLRMKAAYNDKLNLNQLFALLMDAEQYRTDCIPECIGSITPENLQKIISSIEKIIDFQNRR